jgi:hypothetical protein
MDPLDRYAQSIQNERNFELTKSLLAIKVLCMVGMGLVLGTGHNPLLGLPFIIPFLSMSRSFRVLIGVQPGSRDIKGKPVFNPDSEPLVNAFKAFFSRVRRQRKPKAKANAKAKAKAKPKHQAKPKTQAKLQQPEPQSDTASKPKAA